MKDATERNRAHDDGASPQIGIAYFPAHAGAMNPYLRLLYENLRPFGFEVVPGGDFRIGWLLRSRGRVRILHFHWGPDEHYVWDPWSRRPANRSRRLLSRLRLVAFAARLAAARILGYRIVWTIHEVYPPHCKADRGTDRAGARLLAGASHLLLAHDVETAQRARAEFGPALRDIQIVEHASYVGVYPTGAGRAEVRGELGIAADAFVFLCFGKLRRDKAIVLLLEAFRGYCDPKAVLIVAGLPEHKDVAAAVAVAAAADPRIVARLDFVPPEDVTGLHAAADACVLARGETWTSGSLILALSLGVPVVAAQLPGYEKLTGGEEAGWSFAPGDVDSLRDALARAAAEPALARAKREAARRRGAAAPTWGAVAERTAALLHDRLRSR